MKAFHWLVAALLLALALAGCAGSGRSDGQAGAPSAVEDLKAAQAAFGRGDKDEYLRLLTRAIDAGTLPDVSQAQAYAARGAYYTQKGQYERAIADCSAAIQLKPDYPEAYVNRAIAHTAGSQFDQAIADLDAAIRLKPDYALAYGNRAANYARKGQHDRAIADYDEAIRLRPDYPEAYFGRGLSYYARKEFDRAIADLNDVIRLKPDFAMAYIDRGLAKASKGQHDLALPDYDQAIRLNPKEVFAYYSRATSQLVLGHHDYAAADLVRGLELQPASAPMVLWLHVTRIETGADDHDEFARNIAKVDRTQWPDPLIELYLGRVTPEQVLAASRTNDPKIAQERDCFASFNIAEYHLQKKQEGAAKAALHHVVDACGDYGRTIQAVASVELRKLGQ